MRNIAALGLLLASIGHCGQWDFLEVHLREPRFDELESLVPIGRPGTAKGRLEQLASEFPEAAKAAQDELKKRGYTENLEVAIKIQDYVIPDQPELTAQLEHYALQAFEHLRHRLTPLPRIQLYAVHAQYGMSLGVQDKTLIFGNGFVRSTTMAFIKDERVVLPLQYLKSHNGGMNIEEEGRTYIFIGTGNGALQASFSELLHTITSSTRAEYKKRVGTLKSVQADEAFVEGVSYILAHEMVEKLEIPKGHKHIEKMLHNMERQGYHGRVYQYLGESIRWLKKNGLQKGFDLYRENPALYMYELGALDHE